jgi:spermidine synthase
VDTSKPNADGPGITRGLPWLVALSGATGLLYESLWMRSFGLVFGNTTDAVGLVLATFMGGLALGSWLAGRKTARDPLRTYARVELGIGASALLTLPLLKALPAVYGALAGRGGLSGAPELAGRALAAALIVLPTTVLLGATVPLVVAFLSRARADFHGSFAGLYLANTLGGAAGVLAGSFLLLPALGVTGTFVAAAAANLLIGAIARRAAQDSRPAPAPAPQKPAPPPARLPALPAVLAAASGACALGIEVLWTRTYVLVIGSSVYAFNLMLVAVLLGIVAGTALHRRLRARNPERLAAALFLSLGLLVLAGQVAVNALPGAFLALMRVLPVTFAAHQSAGFALCLLSLLPVTIVLGFTFPLLTRLVPSPSPQHTTGALYAWNTGGAIAGALATDFLLVRALGLQRSYVVLAALPLMGAAWAFASSWSWRPALRLAAPVAVALAAAGLARSWAPWNPLVMTAGVYKYGLEWRERPGFELASGLAAERAILFYREGHEAVVAVAESRSGGRRFLSVNGKTDAGSSAEDVLTQKFIAHVPLLLHPAPRRALIVGWGAGATAASAALHPLELLECVEIEPATFEAAPFFPDFTRALRGDPRFRIVFRDGRNHLLASRERWDVIVSEPSNPWISGVSNLFTREFYEIVRGRLAEDGVFGQWFHYYDLQAPDVKVELKTFRAVFPHVSIWLVPPVGGRLTADLLLVGSPRPHALDHARLESLFRGGAVGEDLRRTGVIVDEASLLASWAMDGTDVERYAEDAAAFPRGTPLNTDNYPYIELVSPRRNVVPRAEAAQAALAQFAALSDAGRGLLPPLTNHAGLAEGGPAAAALYRELGERHAAAGLRGRAVRALEEASRLQPSSGAILARLGELLLEAGRPGEAESRLQAAQRADPTLEKPFDLLGGLYIDRRDYARAEAVHREHLRHHPRAVAAHLRLGGVLARLGRWNEAREVLLAARRLDPQAPIDPELLKFIEAQTARR